MVCGSIGYGGISDIRDLYSFLRKEGFDVLDHIVHGRMDYSDIGDFRDKKELSNQIVDYDLNFVKEADVLVVVAENPSFGTGIEVFIAKSSRKKIILLAKEPIPTPWPIHFSDHIVMSEYELVRLLHELQEK